MVITNCEYCNETFTNKVKLTKHISSIHVLSPLIKWSGGKKDEIPNFKKYIPSNYDTYLEPFVGGGSLFFNLCPNKSVISDVHPELIDFYTSIKQGYIKDIYDFMTLNLNNEETYYKIRDNMVIHSALDNAKRFYYLRKTCFRGMLRYNQKGKFNIPYGRYKNIEFDSLLNERYTELLSKTEILNKGFEYIFENYNDENNFMFLDPPYDSPFTDYGYCIFDREKHIILANLFKTTKIKCLMIIGKTDFIVNLYKDYIKEEYSKKYRFKIHSNRVGSEIDNNHLIISNYS